MEKDCLKKLSHPTRKVFSPFEVWVNKPRFSYDKLQSLTAASFVKIEVESVQVKNMEKLGELMEKFDFWCTIDYRGVEDLE